MLFDMVTPKSETTARDVLLWLQEMGKNMPKDEESAVILADLYPGFVDVSYLLHVWKEIDK